MSEVSANREASSQGNIIPALQLLQQRRRKRSTLIDWAQYLGIRGVAGLMQCFDVNQNLRMVGQIGSLYAKMNPRRRARALANARRSLPELSEEEAEKVVDDSIRHMFQVFVVESLAMPRLITPGSWQRYIRMGCLGPAMDLLLRRQPAIFITGHCGNWEVLGYTTAVLGFPLHALARPLDNVLVNRWLTRVRQARGMMIITKWGAVPVLRELLSHSGHIAFIADQNAGDQGLFVPFFGRLASSYKSIGLLAMRYQVPIVAGHARRIGETFQYELSLTDYITPAEWRDQPDPLFYLTARYARAIEQMVRAEPGQYLWLHRRWKSRPRHERLGRPMPKRLLEKLQSLPWMTDDELGRIIEDSERAATEKNTRSN